MNVLSKTETPVYVSKVFRNHIYEKIPSMGGAGGGGGVLTCPLIFFSSFSAGKKIC